MDGQLCVGMSHIYTQVAFFLVYKIEEREIIFSKCDYNNSQQTINCILLS